MRTRRQATIEDLRRAIDSLPRDTRVAMLDGIRQNDIVVGAYTDRGGICPMLAAFRAGGRASCISFAEAWDAFAFRGARRRRARRATRRELLVLASHLEVSLLGDDRPREADPSAELDTRPGQLCLKDMRRYGDYERLLALVESGGRDPVAVFAASGERTMGLEPATFGLGTESPV